MGRFAEVVDNIVVNVVVASPEVAAERGFVAVDDEVGPGWVRRSDKFFPPLNPPARSSFSLSRRSSYARSVPFCILGPRDLRSPFKKSSPNGI